MTTNAKKGILPLVIIILISIIAFGYILQQSNAGMNISVEEQKNIDEASRILHNEYCLAQSLDIEKKSEKAFIPMYYSLVETYKLQGIKESDAIAMASEYLIREQAMYEKAISLGYQISWDEAKTAMYKEFDDAQNAENYGVVMEAIYSAGLSKDDYVNTHASFRQWQDSIDLYYQSIKKQYMEENLLDELDDWDEAWRNHWDSLVQDVIQTSKESSSIKIISAFGQDYSKNINILSKEAGIETDK